MKIEFLLDEGSRFEKQTLMWHGTKVENIRSILKHGLLVNKKDVSPWRTYGLNVPSGPFGYDLAGESYRGIYVAEDISYAVSSASGWPEIAVIAIKLRKSGLAIDEDNIYETIEKMLRDVFNDVYENKFLQLSPEGEISEKEIHSIFIEKFNEEYRITLDRDSKSREDAWKEFQSYEPLLKQLIDISHSGAKKFKELSDEEKAKVRLEMRKVYDKITLKLGRLKSQHVNKIGAHRHLGDIGFSGAARIVSIYIYNKKTKDVTLVFETDSSIEANNQILKFSEQSKRKNSWL